MNAHKGQAWHPEDIKAALRKRGTSLAEISRRLGLHPESCRVALRRPWPRCERAIARALGVSPSELWPDRYEDGHPIRAQRGKRHTHVRRCERRPSRRAA